MGIFDLMTSMQKMADDPNLSDAAASIGKAAAALPDDIKGIRNLMAMQLDMSGRILAALSDLGDRLDRMADPIPRPPFGPADVEQVLAYQEQLGAQNTPEDAKG